MKKSLQFLLLIGLVIILPGNPSFLESWLNLNFDLNSLFSFVWFFLLILLIEFVGEWKKNSKMNPHTNSFQARLSKKAILFLFGFLLLVTILILNPFFSNRFNLNILTYIKPILIVLTFIWGSSLLFDTQENKVEKD